MKLGKLATTLFLLVILSIAIYTFSWFANNDDIALQNKSNIEIVVGNKLEVCYMKANGTYSAWGSSINTSYGEILSEAELKESTICDITGDGINFYNPKALDDFDNAIYPLETIAYKSTSYPEQLNNLNGYFIELRIKIRSSSKTNIYISDASSVSPLTDAEHYDYVSFDKMENDYIAGAVRVAFIEETTTGDQLNAIWIPNDRYQLIVNPDNSDYVAFEPNGERESGYGYLTNDTENGELVMNYYTDEDYVTGKVKVGNGNLVKVKTKNNSIVNVTGLVEDQSPVLRFTEDGVSEKAMTIRMWIEGTDREADKACNQGSFTFKISLFGFPKEEIEDPDLTQLYLNSYYRVSTRKNSVNPEDYIYSYNGIDWYPIGNELAGIREHEWLYIRKKETVEYKYTNYLKIEIPREQ